MVIVRQFINIPTWVILSIIALWCIKDVLLFPSVWRAYDISTQRNVQPIVGMKGIVKQQLDPSGYVKVRGELWQAELVVGKTPVKRGEKIEVKGIRGLTLLVKNINE
jgi:membrane-bound serine protease (ClpP class)